MQETSANILVKNDANAENCSKFFFAEFFDSERCERVKILYISQNAKKMSLLSLSEALIQRITRTAKLASSLLTEIP